MKLFARIPGTIIIFLLTTVLDCGLGLYVFLIGNQTLEQLGFGSFSIFLGILFAIISILLIMRTPGIFFAAILLFMFAGIFPVVVPISGALMARIAFTRLLCIGFFVREWHLSQK